MAITSINTEQKKALEAAGFTTKGKTVYKDGKAVGGINENGQFWSGSAKVKSIMKSAPAPKVETKKTEAKAPAKSEPKAKPLTTPKVTTTALGGGRGDGKAETARRKAEGIKKMATTALDRADKAKKEPVASAIYDKVYGKGRWKTKAQIKTAAQKKAEDEKKKKTTTNKRFVPNG